MAQAHKSIAAMTSFLCGVQQQYEGDNDYVEVVEKVNQHEENDAKVSLDEKARQSFVSLLVCCKKVHYCGNVLGT